uniref:Uncharacterized protein n=1 Tax=Angiostrongylus cantonensis TaxID=6313 RepID=A0A0K0DCE7_ANGCA
METNRGKDGSGERDSGPLAAQQKMKTSTESQAVSKRKCGSGARQKHHHVLSELLPLERRLREKDGDEKEKTLKGSRQPEEEMRPNMLCLTDVLATRACFGSGETNDKHRTIAG